MCLEIYLLACELVDIQTGCLQYINLEHYFFHDLFSMNNKKYGPLNAEDVASDSYKREVTSSYSATKRIH